MSSLEEVPSAVESGEVEVGDDISAVKPPAKETSAIEEEAKNNDVAGNDQQMTSEQVRGPSFEPVPPLPYTVPHWSGDIPDQPVSLSIIKNGTIIGEVDISNKPYVLFGRLPSCDVHLEHPSISRYHAVLQYRPPSSKGTDSSQAEGDDEQREAHGHTLFSSNPRDMGHYIFDLGSTHGTYLNKTRINPRCYYRVRVGQMIKFGGSSRLFLLEVCIARVAMLG